MLIKNIAKGCTHDYTAVHRWRFDLRFGHIKAPPPEHSLLWQIQCCCCCFFITHLSDMRKQQLNASGQYYAHSSNQDHQPISTTHSTTVFTVRTSFLSIQQLYKPGRHVFCSAFFPFTLVPKKYIQTYRLNTLRALLAGSLYTYKKEGS